MESGRIPLACLLPSHAPLVGHILEADAYKTLMKYGLDSNDWNEFILEAYVNHWKEVIFLRGLPDVEESRPHSRRNS